MDQRNRKPLHALLVEDDPASGNFLLQALQSLGWSVVVCGNRSAAKRRFSETRFEFLLIDHNLPDGSGLTLLGELLAESGEPEPSPIAVASSAEWDAGNIQAALAAGFAGVLRKPCSIADLAAAIGRHMPETLALLDDTSALSAAGSSSNVAALRRLLQEELKQLPSTLPEGEMQRAAFGNQLHRLIASAGFCGTPAMGAAASELRSRLVDNADHADAWRRFQRVLAATRSSLDQETARP